MLPQAWRASHRPAWHLALQQVSPGYSLLGLRALLSRASVPGLFIYVGSVGITAEEFAKCDDPAFAASRPRGARFYMYACMFFGFVVVALLQLVPDD